MEISNFVEYRPIVSVDDHWPLVLEGFSFCAADNSLIIFGGRDIEENLLTNDIYRFTLTEGWTKVTVNNAENGPSPRSGAICCCFRSKIHIFGGFSDVDGVLSDFYLFDLSDGKWSKLPEGPCRRINCALVADGDDFLYLYGGNCENSAEFNCLGDIWAFDGKSSTWISFSSIADSPGPLAGYCAAKVEENLIFFGGKSKNDLFTNKLHVFDLKSKRWKNPPVRGNPPSPRCFHSSVNVKNKFLAIFGGVDRENWELDDLWFLDCESFSWLKPSLNEFGEAPCRRFGHAMVILEKDHSKKELIIFGGSSEVDPGSNEAQSILNDMYALDLDSVLATCRISETNFQNNNSHNAAENNNLFNCNDCFDC